MDIVNNPHDKYLKKTFEDIEVAKDFLSNYLPKNVLSIVDINRLSHEKESFIEKDLDGLYSDVLFKTLINGKDGYVYFLIEHKSYIAKQVGLQLLEYIIKIWKLKSSKNKIPIVIPLVVYHGKQNWNVETNLISLIDGIDILPKEILSYIPNYEYIVKDLSRFSDEEIKGGVILQILIKVIRSIYKNKDDCINVMIEASKALDQLEEKEKATEYFEVFIRYIMSVKSDIEIKDVYEAIKSISHERSEFVMTIAEKLMNEGIEKGKIEGKLEAAINMKKLGADIEFISKATGLSIEYLKKEVFKDK